MGDVPYPYNQQKLYSCTAEYNKEFCTFIVYLSLIILHPTKEQVNLLFTHSFSFKKQNGVNEFLLISSNVTWQ